MNLATLLARAARIRPDAGAVRVGRVQFQNYRELALAAASMAGSLRQDLALDAGDRVALLMSNCGVYVQCMFACWQAGLACVPVNAKLHAREIAWILDNCAARVVLVTRDLETTVSEALGLMNARAPVVIATGSREFARMDRAAPWPLVPVTASDPAWLFYTSGTTGRPKGATLTHGNLAAMAYSYLADVDSVGPQDCLLHAAPMSHGSGCYITPYVLAMAAQVVPESARFEPAEIFSLLPHHPGVGMFAAPTMVNRLIRAPEAGGADLRNLRTIVYGGGPMYAEDCKAALAVLGPKLAQIYGQGESPMTITVLPKRAHTDTAHPDFERRLASVGYAHSAVEVRTVGAGGHELPPGEIGEIVVRGGTVMAGYWDNPSATAAALEGGWLHTGDLGVFDDCGYLTLKDRSKDMIISGGSNIYPREVEEVLLLHPAVAEASLIGRRHPDWGEEAVAYIAPRPGRSVTREELDRLCNEHIARFKRPKDYVFIESMPKNNYGKIVKTELRAMDAARPPTPVGGRN